MRVGKRAERPYALRVIARDTYFAHALHSNVERVCDALRVSAAVCKYEITDKLHDARG